jgi:glutamate 5-kinase
MRKTLIDSKRIVIKVGSSTLTYETGAINLSRMDKLSQIISDLLNQNKEIVLVTSGAIAVGVSKLKLSERPKSTQDKQAAAAVGQSELMHLYSKFFSEYGHVVAQILLTKDVVEEDKKRFNVINTFENLIKKGILPIVNENDTVATDEIEFGDNDTLSALVATLIHADLLILLSDIEGLYEADPRSNPNVKLISMVDKIDDTVLARAGGASSDRGTGGMTTKLKAATIATQNHIHMVIALGEHPEIITDILQGKDIGTLFIAQ